MDSQQRWQNIIAPCPSSEVEIGRWLGAFQDTRERMLERLEGLSQPIIDWQPPNSESSIGTVLYHIALIEADWLYEEVHERPIPPEVEMLFLFHHRDSLGHLTHIRGFSFQQYLTLPETVRSLVLEVYAHMGLADLRRARAFERYDVTPEWVLHHLMQHEAEHRSQIGSLRARVESDMG